MTRRLSMCAVLAAVGCTGGTVRPVPDTNTPIETDDTETTDDTDDTDDTDTDDTDTDTGQPTDCDPFVLEETSVSTSDCRLEFGSYSFTEKWRIEGLHGTQFWSVIQMDDDNGDGVVGIGDTPSVIASLQDRDAGVPGYYVLKGTDGSEEARWVGFQRVAAATGPGTDVSSMAVSFAGTAARAWIWDARTEPFPHSALAGVRRSNDAPDCFQLTALGDLDGDGWAELLYGSRSYSPVTTVEWSDPADEYEGLARRTSFAQKCTAFPVNLDNTAPAERVVGRTVYADDNSTLCTIAADEGVSWPADFTGDGATNILLLTDTEFVLANTDCSVIRRKKFDEFEELGAPASFFGEHAIAPTVDRLGTDLVFSGAFGYGEGGAWVSASLDANLDLHIIRDLSDGTVMGPVVDLDGDGLYEVFFKDELVNPRTGAVVARLPFQYSGDVRSVADVDGDGRAEILAIECHDEDCTTHDGVVYEGDDLARTFATWQEGGAFRPGHWRPNGTFAKAGQYPPVSHYNVINAQQFDSEWEGAGVDLRVAFAHVCKDECWKYKLHTWVTLENRGAVDLIRPVELRLMGRISDSTRVLDTVVVESLKSGTVSEAFPLSTSASMAYAHELWVEVAAPGWSPQLCEGLPVTPAPDGACD